MASRRRRRKSLGGVVSSVESRVRRIEKRPGSKRLKTNVVTTEKILPRAVVTKVIAQDAVTPNEAAFGTTVVTDTQPTEYLKEGTTWVDPNTGEAQVYSTDLSSFITYADVTAQADAADALDAATTAQTTANGKNKVTYSTSDASGTGTAAGDIWWKYTTGGVITAQWEWTGSTWSSKQIGNLVIASIDAGKITAGTISASIEMTSATITGGLIRTAATGERIEITNSDQINFHNSAGTLSASITPYTEAGYDSGLLIGDGTGNFNVGLYVASDIVNLGAESAASITFVPGAGVVLSSTSVMTIESDILSITGSSSFSLISDIFEFDVGSNTLTFSSLGDLTMGTSSDNSTFGLRNIKALSSVSGFTASTDTTGGVGDVMLIYTA